MQYMQKSIHVTTIFIICSILEIDYLVFFLFGMITYMNIGNVFETFSSSSFIMQNVRKVDLNNTHLDKYVINDIEQKAN